MMTMLTIMLLLLAGFAAGVIVTILAGAGFLASSVDDHPY